VRVCDICKDPEHQPVSRASIHVKARSSGGFDICDVCLDRVEENKSPARSAAARRRRGAAFEPRELTDSA
jgi:hypothetical protein